jgi:hypothetical protein
MSNMAHEGGTCTGLRMGTYPYSHVIENNRSMLNKNRRMQENHSRFVVDSKSNELHDCRANETQTRKNYRANDQRTDSAHAVQLKQR